MSDQNNATSPLHWFPLASQQMRLRSLSQMFLYHPSCQGAEEDKESAFYYLTFHETAMSSPFYTSVTAKMIDNRVTWPDLDQKVEEWGSAKAIIIRLWFRSDAVQSSCMAVWGVCFSGLTCVGDKIHRSLTSNLTANSLLFKLHQHYFVYNDCLNLKMEQNRFFEVPFMTLDSCKVSYERLTLSKLVATLRALKHSEISNNRVKKEISAKGLEPNNVSVAPQTTSLRQQIFTVQPKHPCTKMEEINLSIKIEDIKFRIELLKEERNRLKAVVANKNIVRDKGIIEVDMCNNVLMENYHSLSKEKEKLEAWLKSFQEYRIGNLKTSDSLKLRRNQLISQLSEIFPIKDSSSQLPTICHVALPSSENMRERDDTDLAVGLGWAAHLTVMISSLLGVPLRYPTSSGGSRSMIEDQILNRIPDKEREFPLYAKGVERVRFEYGVYLLNKNIAQLRWYCGENTADLRPTLFNLNGLLSNCTSSAYNNTLSSNSSPARLQLPNAPSVLSGVSRTMPGTPITALKSPERRIQTGESDDDGDESCELISKTKDCESDSSVMNGTDKEEEEEQNSSPAFHKKDFEGHNNSHVKDEICNTSVIEDVVKYSINITNTVDEELTEANASVDIVEEAVEAADMFWDSVASRTEALAAPNSFKTHLSRPYK